MDMQIVFSKFNVDYKKLDYISCWFLLGTEYIKKTISKCAFVSTNSICQGEQVALLWKLILRIDVVISFAHTSFKWSNNAKSQATVTCIIVGLQDSNCNVQRQLFTNNNIIYCKNINPYLSSGKDIIVRPENASISGLPLMQKGCAPGDGGNLLLEKYDAELFLSNNPSASKFIKTFIGADEYINGYIRFCLWINEKDVNEAYSYPFIYKRVTNCKKFRENSKKEATQKKASIPYAFDEIRYKETDSIIIPQTSSELRPYIPIGFIKKGIIISNGARVIYDGTVSLFGVLTSKMHMLWINAVSGRLETRIQYSNTLCYNTFSFPKISDSKKQEIESAAEEILLVRAEHSEKTLSEMYDPKKMPQDLRDAHHTLDLIVESCYRKEPFISDEERLEHLFKLYETMTNKSK